MTAQNRKRIIIISIIILVLVGIFLIIWRLTNFGNPRIEDKTNEAPKFVAPSAKLEYKDVPPAVNNTEFTVMNLARNYAERFGSWSTDQPGHNLEELYPLSTTKMIKYLKTLNTDTSQSQFSGVSTKTITAEIENLNSQTAEVFVKTQRLETKTSGPALVEDTIYQDIKVSLVKSGEDWLVDGAYWQEINP
ncbi:MAG: hypothetical protein WC465_02720 [Patescibacteria group bacterium]